MLHQRIQLPHCELSCFVSDPSIDPQRIRKSVVICPGGAYGFLSPREAEPIALTFNAMGFNAYVVWYRIAPQHRHPAPLEDVAQAVAWVRAHAAEHNADPNAIAVLGFSAGGHAACHLGVRWHDEGLMASFGLTSEQAKPNAQVLCYPVITAGEFAHRGSFVNLTDTEDIKAHQAFSLEKLVTANTPPTFLWHTWSDGGVPVMNTLLLCDALYANRVRAEVHLFPQGGHGIGLANEMTAEEPSHIIPECQQWPEMAARFLNLVLG